MVADGRLSYPPGQGERLQYYDPAAGRSKVGASTDEHSHANGQTLLIERPLPREDGCWEFLIDPPLIPAALGLNDDDRILGCVCAECTIMASGGEVVLREPAVAA